MSAKASPLTTNSKRKFDELYYDDHKNTANGGTPKKTSTKTKNNNNNIERTSPPDKRVKKYSSSASPKVVVLSSDSSSSTSSSKKVNRRQGNQTIDNDNSNYSPSGSYSSRENSCDTKETIIYIKKESALHPKGNELSDDPSSIDSDEMPCISHKTVSLKRPASNHQQGFATPSRNMNPPPSQQSFTTTSTSTQSLLSTPPIQPASSYNSSTVTPKTPKNSFATPSSQSSNVSQKKISSSPFSQHFPNLTRPYLSSPRDTKSPLSTPIKTSSQVSIVSDDVPSPTSVKTGPNHQATLPILSQKPKKFPLSYSQKIGQCVWAPLESNSDNEGMLEEFELFCIKTIRDQDSFLTDKAFEILHTFDNDIKQAKLYVKEHPKQITRRRILTDEQEAKLYKAFNEFHLYKGSLRNLHRAILPEVPYFDLVNYFFIYKKEESKVPPKLSKIVRNGLLRAAQMRSIMLNQSSSTFNQQQQQDSDDSSSSSDDENCSDGAEDTPSRQVTTKKEANLHHEDDDSTDETSDSDEEKVRSTPIKSHSNSNHIRSQTPQSTFCLSDSEEDVSLKDHEYVNDLAQYSNHDTSSQEDRAYIPIENEDSTSTTEVFNFENNEMYELHPPTQLFFSDLN